jgi:hypothetical protein
MAVDLQGNGLSSQRKMQDVLVKPAFTGITAGLLSKVFYPDKSTIYVLGGDRSLAMALGLAVGGASLISTVLTDFALPQIAREDQYRIPASALINLGGAAAGSIGLVALENSSAPSQLGFVSLGALGLLSEVISSYGYYEIFAPAFYKSM